MTTRTAPIDFTYLLERSAGVPDIISDPEVRWRIVRLGATAILQAAVADHPSLQFELENGQVTAGVTYASADAVASTFVEALKASLFDEVFAGVEEQGVAVRRVLSAHPVTGPPGLPAVVYEGLLKLVVALVDSQPFDDGTGLYGRR